MAREANPKTLFHLVPTNQVAQDALLHPDNKQRVSRSKHGPGLEVGYHVPSGPRGHVITRLGRDADLILRESTRELPMSAVHVAFEINPATHLVLLSVRSKRVSSVTFAVLGDPSDDENTDGKSTAEKTSGEKITGDGVVLYAQNYKVSIASYNFKLIWRTISGTGNAEALKALTVQGYEASQQLLQDVRSRDRPTETDNTEAQSWHITRLNTTKGPIFQDIDHLRNRIGSGAYGTVYEAVDRISGHKFAIKVVNLSRHDDVEAARAILHREIKVMQMVKHEHIIEYLGHQLFHTLYPEIFMPLRSGSLTSLAKSPPPDIDYEQLCFVAMGQMLSALDYLANKNLIHRDLKPDNVLYSLPNSRYLFQLADFGLAHHRSLAKTFCGTGYYQAPELWPVISGVNAGQSPKLDIWSLFACIVAVRSRLEEFPPHTNDYGIVLSALRAKISTRLEPMARLHPDRRASAAQMLVVLFDSKDLTTPKSKIPPIESHVPAAEPSNRPQTGHDRGKAPRRPPATAQPLIVYPPRRRTLAPGAPGIPVTRLPPPIPNRGGNLARPAAPQLQPIRAQRDGVAKRRSVSRTPRASTPARNPPHQKPPAPKEPPPVQEPPVLRGSSEALRHIPGSFVD